MSYICPRLVTNLSPLTTVKVVLKEHGLIQVWFSMGFQEGIKP